MLISDVSELILNKRGRKAGPCHLHLQLSAVAGRDQNHSPDAHSQELAAGASKNNFKAAAGVDLLQGIRG